MDKTKIDKQLVTFKQRVQAAFKPQKIILYGSYAQNNANEYSDIDILVVSNTFKDMDIDERSTKLYTITQDLHPDFQAHGFTIKEIENALPYSTLGEALRTGVSI